MKRKIFISFAVVTFLAYIISYVVIRNNHKLVMERDGCPEPGCVYIYFPANAIFEIYSPMMIADQKITGVEFVISHFL